MTEIATPPLEATFEQVSMAHILARSIGGVALTVAGIYAGRKLTPYIKSEAYHLADRLDIVERRGHPQMVNTLQSLAESFGVAVTSEHIEYWQTILTAARAVDELIDENKSADLGSEVGKLITGEPIPGMLEDEAKHFSSIILNASKERHSVVMQGLDVEQLNEKVQASSSAGEIMELRKEEGRVLASHINTLNENIRTVSNPEEMLALRRQEGAFFGRILTLDNPTNDPAISDFNKTIVELCVTGYVFDSMVDLSGDFKNGITSVVPSVANYLAIGKEVASDGLTSLSHLSTRAVTGLAIVGLRHIARKTLHTPARKAVE